MIFHSYVNLPEGISTIKQPKIKAGKMVGSTSLSAIGKLFGDEIRRPSPDASPGPMWHCALRNQFGSEVLKDLGYFSSF